MRRFVIIQSGRKRILSDAYTAVHDPLLMTPSYWAPYSRVCIGEAPCIVLASSARILGYVLGKGVEEVREA